MKLHHTYPQNNYLSKQTHCVDVKILYRQLSYKMVAFRGSTTFSVSTVLDKFLPVEASCIFAESLKCRAYHKH